QVVGGMRLRRGSGALRASGLPDRSGQRPGEPPTAKVGSFEASSGRFASSGPSGSLNGSRQVRFRCRPKKFGLTDEPILLGWRFLGPRSDRAERLQSESGGLGNGKKATQLDSASVTLVRWRATALPDEEMTR